MAVKLAVASFIALSLSSTPFRVYNEDLFRPDEVDKCIGVERVLSVYEYAEHVTGAPARILFGIACVESDQRDSAVGDNGRSLGRFQINERFRESRVKTYGNYDPRDPYSAAVIAGRIYMAYLKALGDETLAICAYRQGVEGVRKHGATKWYSDRVYARIDKGAYR